MSNLMCGSTTSYKLNWMCLSCSWRSYRVIHSLKQAAGLRMKGCSTSVHVFVQDFALMIAVRICCQALIPVFKLWLELLSQACRALLWLCNDDMKRLCSWLLRQSRLRGCFLGGQRGWSHPPDGRVFFDVLGQGHSRRAGLRLRLPAQQVPVQSCTAEPMSALHRMHQSAAYFAGTWSRHWGTCWSVSEKLTSEPCMGQPASVIQIHMYVVQS